MVLIDYLFFQFFFLLGAKPSLFLITTRKAFGFGTYQWKVTLPKGVGLWPAVWFSGEITWPPEIDVIEAYSDSKGNWSNPLNTNVHIGSNGENHKQVGARRHGSYINKNEDIKQIKQIKNDDIKPKKKYVKKKNQISLDFQIFF